MADTTEQAREDTAALVSRLGITGANYASAAMHSGEDDAINIARAAFAGAVADAHKALADRDALAAKLAQAREALRAAEAALAGIAESNREPADDVARYEAIAAKALPRVRAALAQEPAPAATEPKRAAFAEACATLPPDTNWGDPITPAMVRHIVDAARAAHPASAPAEPVARLDDGEAWSFCRKVMSDGRDVAVWHADEGYELHSARMDAQAAKRGDELMAMVAAAIAAARREERERLCAAIKAADDKASEGDYMLDSDDCISVIRGTWNPGA